jgi:6-phosphogluconate dehydrogenase
MATFGLTGLATMGANLARNIARNGFEIVVHNRSTERLERFLSEHGDEGPIEGARSLEELVGKLERPRTVMVMVKAGDAVDAVISELAPLLDEGDTIADGGNSHFRDSQRRSEELAERGLRFLGVGVSGGEEGALNGPSIMPGGDEAAYRDVEEILTTIAAEVDGTPCCTYVGPGGAGHYVKMVHNGIEYGDMQLIAEAYDLLRAGAGMSLEEIAGVFREWNEGPLESFLIEIAATVLSQPDDRGARSGDERSARGSGALLDAILDEAEQKGTGRWTAQDALELGIPLTTITEAVFARSLSALRGEREQAAERLEGPRPSGGAPRELVDDVARALYASKIVAYAQGFTQMAAASEQHGWGVDLGAMATIWRGGCIIRARFLDRIREAYDADPHTANLLQVDPFRGEIADAQDPWRRVVSTAVELGIPSPAFSSALAYYDGYRRARGPANLIQGLRDLFGAHTYKRVDAGDETFHTRWGE